VPAFPFAPDQCKYGFSPLLPIERCSQSAENFSEIYDSYYPALQAAVNQVPGATLLNTAKYFCSDDTCNMTQNGTLLYADDDHVNHQGSALIFERLFADNLELKNVITPR
jgi:lysophospholipase L1-like esterase